MSHSEDPDERDAWLRFDTMIGRICDMLAGAGILAALVLAGFLWERFS